MRLATLLGLFVLATAFDCTPHPTPQPQPPPRADSGAVTCADVCQHGEAIGCSWANPTPAGATCIDVCRNATEGGPIEWDLGCRARARDCAAERACQ